MTHALAMIRTNPTEIALDPEPLARCVDACVDCAQACTACADACLGESDPASLVRCISLNLDCADICEATGRIATRETAATQNAIRPVLEACARLCRMCADECGRHAELHEHCRVCAEACRQCEGACGELLESLRPL